MKEVDSTNNYARELLTNSGPVPDGTVIMAESQYEGKGQASNTWLSEPGKNLTFSIILNCSFLHPSEQFSLSMAVSLGVLDTVKQELGKQSCIKWPNDIYFGNKKLGGILIENILAGMVLKSSVIGIGLNVNQTSFPQLKRAISLRQIKNVEYDLETLLKRLCHSVEIRYLQLKAGKGDHLKRDYLKSLAGYGVKMRFKTGSEEFEGIIRDITKEGKLLIESGEGSNSYDKKEIEFIFL